MIGRLGPGGALLPDRLAARCAAPGAGCSRSIREDEDAVRSLGKNVYAYKMQSLIIGGMFGAPGRLRDRAASRPRSARRFFATDITFFAYTVLLLGGAARVLGPVVGSVIFWFLITFLDVLLRPGHRPATGPAHPGLDHDATPGQPDPLHPPGPGADAADDLPTTGDLRRPKGAGARCPLTPASTSSEAATTTAVERARPPAPRSRTCPTSPGAPKPDPILVADDVTRTLRRPHRRRRRPRRDPARRHHRADRAQRCRQDHVLQPADRLRPARRRRPGRSTARRLNGVPAYKVARLGMVRTFQLTKVLSKLTVHREHAPRRHRPARRDVLRAHVRRRCGAARRTPTPSGPTSCWRASSSTRSARTSPARCPAASASCSRWRAR